MATVYIPAQLRSLTDGLLQVKAAGSNVREVVAALDTQFPGLRDRLCQGDDLSPGLQVSIDGVMNSQGLRAKVGPESEIHFLPAFGGG